MNFFNHTQDWIKGELFEAGLITAFGILSIVGAIVIHRMSALPSGKALLWPMVIAGIIYAAIGIGMTISNNKRAADFPQTYSADAGAFVKAEKKRVEDFQYGYTISKVVATVFFIATLLLFWFTKSPLSHGIGLGLTYFALAGLVVDYFSQERADIYYKAILQALG